MLRRPFHLACMGAWGVVLASVLISCIGEPFTACQENHACSEKSEGRVCDDLICCSDVWIQNSPEGCGVLTTSSTGGMGGSGGQMMSSSGGTGGSSPCPEPETKLCGTLCVSIGDPSYGCGDFDSCDPCMLDHATADCGTHAVCSVAECAENYEDCDTMSETGCEADLLNDVATCGSCMKSCTNTDASCENGVCAGPCGPIPLTGLHVCWVYGSAVMANQHVGFAGGIASPSQSQTIEMQFLDPMSGCVNPNVGEPFVWCNLGSPPGDADIQFRPGLHLGTGQGTITGTWDCSDASCSGDGYIYFNGVEIGSYINGTTSGVLATVPHFTPPNLLNLKVDSP